MPPWVAATRASATSSVGVGASARVVGEPAGEAPGPLRETGVEQLLHLVELLGAWPGVGAFQLARSHDEQAQLSVRDEVDDVGSEGQGIDAVEPVLHVVRMAEARAAVSRDDGRHALGQEVLVGVDRFRKWKPAEQLVGDVTVVVEIDEAGRHDQSRRIDLAPGGSRGLPDGDDAVASDGDVAGSGKLEAAPVEGAVSESDVVALGARSRGAENQEEPEP